MALHSADPTIVRRRTARGEGLLRDERLFAILLTLPALIAVFFVVGFPWAYSAWLSLHEVDLATRTWHFVGVDNYLRVFPGRIFQESLARTAYFAFTTVFGGVLLGLGMALVLNEKFRGRGFMRSVLLVPWATSAVVVGVLWAWLYNGQYGTLNAVLYKLGLIQDYVPWLRDGFVALNLVALAYIWNSAPIAGLLFLAALQAVPPSLYAAAKIDGAGAWSRFAHITLPWLRPMMLNVLLLTTINSVMAFDLIYIITSGGPGTATTVFSFLGYETTFAFFRYGEGAAILYLLSILCLLLALLYIRLLYAQPRTKATRGPQGEAAGGVGGGAAATLAPIALPGRGPSARFVAPRRVLGLIARGRLRQGAFYALVLLIAVWSLGPYLLLVSWSLMPSIQLVAKPPQLLPWPPMLDNYQALLQLELGPKGLYLASMAKVVPAAMWNSFVVSTAVTAINLVIGSLAGYAYARYTGHWFMQGTLVALLMTRMIPAIALVVPFFMMFRQLGLQDTKAGLIIAFSAFILPLAIWIMRGYFETVPRNLERAAIVDGCTRLQAFYRVLIPVSMPGVIATGIFCFVVAWNQFIFPLILTSTTKSQTIPVVLSAMFQVFVTYAAEPGILFATAAVGALPPVVIAFVFQRYLIQGMLSGSTKG